MKKFAPIIAAFFTISVMSQSPPENSSLFPLSEVKPGLTATGFSVFKGEEITSFEAEVIDVQQVGAIREPMILCRLKGPFFEKNGVIAAMSGSPLYVGGRFLGAVAMGWSFSKEPICGVTPAEQMTGLYEKKVSGGASAMQKNGSPADFGSFLDSLGSRKPLTAGLPETLEAEGFSVSYAASPERKMAAAELLPGSIIGVQLVQGDVQITAFGTVSSVKGEKALAFGHSFFGLGEVDFPLVRGRVSAVLPSMLFSFKISEAGDEIGRMTFDSPYGILLEKGRAADLLPVDILYAKSGGGDAKRSVRIVRHPYLSGMLLETALVLLQEQLEGTGDDLHVLVDSLEFEFDEGGRLSMPSQRFGGTSPSGAMTSYIADCYTLLTKNTYRKEKIARIRASVRSMKGREEGKLLELKARSSTVRRGEKIELEAAFLPYEGERIVKGFSFRTDDLPAGQIKVVAGDNLSVYKRVAQSMNELPGDFQGLKKALGEMPRGGALVFAILSDSEGVYSGNRRLPELPPSLQAGIPVAREGSTTRAAEKILAGPAEGPDTGYFEGLLEIKLEIIEKDAK
ncbi:MAG TPA: hypothetical protein PKJ37_12040 [Acidobacteriota bacterium]|nr:hypothetical protein [Acidobacteriota bacterium]HNT18609.1 hypothetical protein [Acidobacteriota bacterium]